MDPESLPPGFHFTGSGSSGIAGTDFLLEMRYAAYHPIRLITVEQTVDNASPRPERPNPSDQVTIAGQPWEQGPTGSRMTLYKHFDNGLRLSVTAPVGTSEEDLLYVARHLKPHDG